MATYIINYDLIKEVKRPPIVKLIKDTYSSWAKLSESSYAVSTADSPETAYNRLAKLIDQNDKLLVVSLSNPYFGQHAPEVLEWLDNNLE